MGMSTGAVVGIVAGVVVVGGGVTYLVIRNRQQRGAVQGYGNPGLAQSRQDVAAALTMMGPAVATKAAASPGAIESLANQYVPGSGKAVTKVVSSLGSGAKSVAKKLKFW